jgi:threonine/homoserine/homoserine lactone efflux protein
MLNFLATGTTLGLSAGFAPGPLLTLVISETLQHGVKAGVKVALAPVVTDLPIILLTVFVLAKLSYFHTALGIIAIGGGCFVVYLGYTGLRIKGVTVELHNIKPISLQKGILTNALNPHPYLFWFGVGAPLTLKAMGQSPLAVTAFIGSFYLCLVGSKIGLALVVGRFRSFLTGRTYRAIMRVLGILLIFLGLWLFYDGLTLCGLWPSP